MRWLPVILLITAAAFKVETATRILASEGLLSSPIRLYGVIGFEIGCSLFLVLANSYYSWLASVLTFTIFGLASGYALSTSQSCHCFGPSISTKVILLGDLAVVAVVVWFRPLRDTNVSKMQSSLFTVLALSFAIGMTGAVTAVAYNSYARSPALDFLLAESILNQPWPLTSEIHPELAPLESGRWLILVLRRDCQHCSEIVESHFVEKAHADSFDRVAVFLTDDSDWQFSFDAVSMVLDKSVSNERIIHWPKESPFVSAPAVFLSADGVVRAAADGTDADRFLVELLERGLR